MAKKNAKAMEEIGPRREREGYAEARDLNARAFQGEPASEPYRQRYEQLKAIREDIEPLWQDVKRYVLPECGRFLGGDEPDAGDESNTIDLSDMDDMTPAYCIDVASKGLQYGTSGSSAPWFEYYVGSYEDREDESREAREWIDSAQVCVKDVLAMSNFYGEVLNLYKEALGFGTSAMIAERDYETVARYKALTCGEYWLGQNAEMRIDTLYRKYSLTAKDIVETYGKENCPDAVIAAFENGNQDQAFYIIQCIQPWNLFGLSGEHPDFEFEDVRFVESADDKEQILYRGGYRSKPFVVMRWSTTGDYVYARSSFAIMALPDIKQLIKLTRVKFMALEWRANPAFAIPNEMANQVGTRIVPGQLIPVTDARAATFQAIVPPDFDLAGVQQNIAYLQDSIKRAFCVHIFQMIQDRTREMTATEVQQLIREKASLLGPIIDRTMSETLVPLLGRTFEIAVYGARMLPQPPPQIAGREIKPYFTSDLAKAQRQADAANQDAVVMAAANMAQIAPEAVAVIDFEAYIRSKAEAYNAPASMIRSKDEVAEIRAAQAQAAQQQQQQAEAAMQVDAANKLGNTPIAPDNALGALAGMTAEGMGAA